VRLDVGSGIRRSARCPLFAARKAVEMGGQNGTTGFVREGPGRRMMADEYKIYKAQKAAIEHRAQQMSRSKAYAELIATVTQFAWSKEQTVGEKSDYYVTLEQLNDIATTSVSELEPRVRVIKGCKHTMAQAAKWADQGACPICLTAELGMLKDSLREQQESRKEPAGEERSDGK
jgi:hypothetical protein